MAIFLLGLHPGVASAQINEGETLDETYYDPGKAFTQCFSAEGISKWRPQFGTIVSAFLYYHQETLTIDARMDDKRQWGIGLSHLYMGSDAYPAEYSLMASLHNKHYWFLSSRHKCAFFFEGFAGAEYVYRTDAELDDEHYSLGDWYFIAFLRLGFDFPIVKRFHGNVALGNDGISFGLTF